MHRLRRDFIPLDLLLSTSGNAPAMSQPDPSVGFLFAADMICALLLGFGLCQAFVYYTHYPKDRKFIKSLIALMLVSEVLHQMLISFTLYWYTITNFDNPAVFSRFIWSLAVPCIPKFVTIVGTQCFFIRRIWHLGDRARLLVGPLLISVALEFSFAMVVVGKSLHCTTFSEFAAYRLWATIPMALAAVIDVCIAIILVLALHYSRTGVKRTDTIINLLILFAMTTGAVTAVWAVGTLIAISLKGLSFIVMFFYYIRGRLYLNSVLASLNARQSISTAGTDTTMQFVTTEKPSLPTVTVIVDSSSLTSSIDHSNKTAV